MFGECGGEGWSVPGREQKKKKKKLLWLTIQNRGREEKTNEIVQTGCKDSLKFVRNPKGEEMEKLD